VSNGAPLGENARTMEFEVVVEVPKGSRNKYEVDHENGHIYLDRELFTATRYPADYGFIPGTLAEDGDPLDVLVHVGEPTFPGCRIRCRPVGYFSMRDEKGPDQKVLAIPTFEMRDEWRDLDDVPKAYLLEIAHFFDIYKELEPGKKTEIGGWHGRAEAEKEIERAYARAAAAKTD
jgi:inorganic pyrophosphatase